MYFKVKYIQKIIQNKDNITNFYIELEITANFVLQHKKWEHTPNFT